MAEVVSAGVLSCLRTAWVGTRWDGEAEPGGRQGVRDSLECDHGQAIRETKHGAYSTS